ncbi:hypothetical protein D3C71_2106660 [compost metagenome]
MAFGLHFVIGQQTKLITLEKFVSTYLHISYLMKSKQLIYVGAYLEKRKGLMADWAKFCNKYL